MRRVVCTQSPAVPRRRARAPAGLTSQEDTSILYPLLCKSIAVPKKRMLCTPARGDGGRESAAPRPADTAFPGSAGAQAAAVGVGRPARSPHPNTLQIPQSARWPSRRACETPVSWAYGQPSFGWGGSRCVREDAWRRRAAPETGISYARLPGAWEALSQPHRCRRVACRLSNGGWRRTAGEACGPLRTPHFALRTSHSPYGKNPTPRSARARRSAGPDRWRA